MALLSWCRPRREMGCPSMRISPWAASWSRKRPDASDDFPAPVRPTIPI